MKSSIVKMTAKEQYERLKKSLECIRRFTGFVPEVALVLGSGLGNYADKIEVECSVPYSEIEDFPISTVSGHNGRYIFGTLNGVKVVCMQGRVHYYEGYDIHEVVLPIRLMGLMGAKVLFLTNAAGGMNPDFHVGDFMMLIDHLSLFVPNPLAGQNIDELGVRFPDMTHIYDPLLQEKIEEAAKENGIDLKKGIYAQTLGPSFESPAEIRMLRTLGADAVGMSTVVEAIAAHHMGMHVCAISSISNLAAGISSTPLTHEEVKIAGIQSAPYFEALVSDSIKKFGGLF